MSLLASPRILRAAIGQTLCMAFLALAVPSAHGDPPGAGSLPEVRARIGAHIGLSADDIIMTNGAAGALNTILKAILDPGDEVIVLNPYFPEYRFYIENHGGRVVPVTSGALPPLVPARGGY